MKLMKLKVACLVGGIIASTMALTLVVHAQACNVTTTVNCYNGNVGDACSALSPNCTGQQIVPTQYPGTVTSLGTQEVITGVQAPGCGLDNSSPDGYCTWVCTLTADCKNQSPQVNVQGGGNMKASGNVCPKGCSACGNGGPN